jgi:hypothetical protein
MLPGDWPLSNFDACGGGREAARSVGFFGAGAMVNAVRNAAM